MERLSCSGSLVHVARCLVIALNAVLEIILESVKHSLACDRSDVQEVEKTVMQSSEPESNRLSVKPTAFKTDAIPIGNP